MHGKYAGCDISRKVNKIEITREITKTIVLTINPMLKNLTFLKIKYLLVNKNTVNSKMVSARTKAAAIIKLIEIPRLN